MDAGPSVEIQALFAPYRDTVGVPGYTAAPHANCLNVLVNKLTACVLMLFL